jgi:biofilm PGA synthesis protein PgaA
MHKKHTHLKFAVSGLSFFFIGLCTSSLANAAIPQQEYDALVKAARQGQTTPAIEQLQSWHSAYPDNQNVLYDLVVIYGWAGKYDDALAYHDQLVASDKTPDYVLKSLGYSTNQVKRYADAEKIYRRLLNKTPNDIDARRGLVNALLGQNRSDDALQYVQRYLPAMSSDYKRSDVPMVMLLAQIYAQRDEPLKAAVAYQDVLRFEPQSRDASRGYAFALAGAGMPYLAERSAGLHPNYFTEEENRQFAHGAAGTTVNYGEAQIGVDHKIPRFATTDAALTENAGVTTRFGEKPVTQFDRMVALRDRQQMKEVVQLYQALTVGRIALPPYATAAAADAYLYLEQPEMARDLYRTAIRDANQGDAADVDSWHVALAYAYSESEQHDAAQAEADRLLIATPPLANRGIPGVEAPNEDYPTSTVLAVQVRMYADRLQQAEDRLAVLRQAAPFNAQIRQTSADLHMSREQPRAALDEYSLLQVDDPQAVGPQVGKGNALLALNQFSEAKAVLPALQKDYPENKGVQNFARQVDIYDRPFLQVTSTFGNGGGEAGAESIVDAQLYSAPLTNSLGDAYRVFSHVSYADGDADPGTDSGRSVSRTRVGVGLDYRVRDLTLAAEINHAIENANRTGAVLSMTKDFSDQWHARLEADSNVNDLSAKAF